MCNARINERALVQDVLVFTRLKAYTRVNHEPTYVYAPKCLNAVSYVSLESRDSYTSPRDSVSSLVEAYIPYRVAKGPQVRSIALNPPLPPAPPPPLPQLKVYDPSLPCPRTRTKRILRIERDLVASKFSSVLSSLYI